MTKNKNLAVADETSELEAPMAKADLWWVRKHPNKWLAVLSKSWYDARGQFRLLGLIDPDPKLPTEWRKQCQSCAGTVENEPSQDCSL